MAPGSEPLTPADSHIGRRIRGKRRALALTVDDLAKALGVDPSVIEAYEHASVSVPSEHLHRYFLPTSERSVP
jgi:ribosome-binding protein aMBF1 (putative translation factor)